MSSSEFLRPPATESASVAPVAGWPRSTESTVATHTSITRLQQDVWAFWHAMILRSAGARTDAIGAASPDVMAECLVMPEEELARRPVAVAVLLQAYRSLAEQVYPATPESIGLCEAYRGGVPEGDTPASRAALAAAVRMRWQFRLLTLGALLALLVLLALSFEVVLGQAQYANLSEAVEVAVRLRSSSYAATGTTADQSRVLDELHAAQEKVLLATSALSGWNQLAARSLLLPSALPPIGNDPDLVLAQATALLTLLGMFAGPVLTGFLGTYCNFARWFVERLGGLALAPGDGISVLVRFLLGVATTILVAVLLLWLAPRHGSSQLWVWVPAVTFLVGYHAEPVPMARRVCGQGARTDFDQQHHSRNPWHR
jgi:hypothetical protein